MNKKKENINPALPLNKRFNAVPGGLTEAESPRVETNTCVCGPEVRKVCAIDKIRPGSSECVKSN